MPIVVYSRTKPIMELAFLCSDDWELPGQVAALEAWLKKNKRKIKKGDHVADIGFAVRKDAAGGGAALSCESMGIMADLGIELFLSEYRVGRRKKK